MKAARLTLAATPPDVREALDRHSFFASAGFAELWTTLKGRPVCWCLRHGDRIAAVMPGVEFGVGPMRRFQAMPDGCYASLIVLDDSLSPEQAAAALMEAVVGYGYARIAVADFHRRFEPCGHLEAISCETLLVDISAPDWQPPDAKLRSEIRKAQREGVQVVSFDRRHHLDSFLEVLSLTEQRHGREPRYPPAFYEALADRAAEDSRVVWLVVLHEDRVAASHINFLLPDMLLNWQICFDKRHAALKANQLLLYTAAEQARHHGARYLNLGATPPEASGVAAFKRKWGGEPYQYATLTARSMLGRLA